jgi:glucose-6-phosphate 1-dehydrogenase
MTLLSYKERINFPTILIIFGATGDLMERKLLPAIFNLYQKKFLPEMFKMIGFSRSNMSEKEYRLWVKKNLSNKKGIRGFLSRVQYQSGLFENLASYKELGKKLGMVDEKYKICTNKLFYLAVPPNYYEEIFKNLYKSGLTRPCGPTEGWTRVLVEKPFGEDLEKAEKLDKLLAKLFKEEQIYRIDHYLAKETVSNLIVFRFANSIFGNIWNKDFIEKIEIRLLEKNGVEKRGLFYDMLGALRDVGQNHLLQMLALITMDMPSNFSAESIRNKKVEVLKSLPVFDLEALKKNTIRGQYQGYLSIPGVRQNSKKETYFKIKLELNHPHWKGVPVILESGKKMKKNLTEIKITFKIVKPCLFCYPFKKDVDKDSDFLVEQHKNTLTFRISPKEGILLSFHSKKPGYNFKIERRELSFFYEDYYKKSKILSEYDKLLIDAFRGDQTLFTSTQEIISSWRFIDPIIKGWEKNVVPLKIYKP